MNLDLRVNHSYLYLRSSSLAAEYFYNQINFSLELAVDYETQKIWFVYGYFLR